MKSENLLKMIDKIDKSFYTVNDVVKIAGQPRQSILVLLSRLTKSGKLLRLRRNFYVSTNKVINYELIAQQLDSESYLSFESALSRYGILSQIPFSITMATTGRSRQISVGDRKIIFRKIKKVLGEDFLVEDKLRIASPEKAFLDMLYMISRGKSDLNIDELDLSILDKQKIKKVAKAYPNYTKELLEKIGKP